ncbi:hypothetical protein [Nocardia ignorata]|uniref:Uncharacterized protein n=1 Tax=Nocardia ignorata TaxID=145285 RepID=A0A4R6P6J9_NOCIG|nr:hypothetical protein [Nocardia ignorata]TDP32773.1 hypothetical protein DFR75_10511 [Nocardia ignorata]
MTARDDRPTRLNLPVDIDVLLALADDCEPDAEAAAAGARIADRLLAADNATPEPHSLSARRIVMRVPGWTVRPLAASSRDGASSSRVVQKQIDQELGIEFTRTPAGAEQTRISVQSFGPGTAAGDVVRIAVHAGEERTEVLVVLYPDANGSLTGQIVTRAVTLAEHLEISIVPGTALGETHTAAITDAVRCSLTPGRNAWRRVAKGLRDGDPVRSAIVAGLS